MAVAKDDGLKPRRGEKDGGRFLFLEEDYSLYINK